MYSPNLVSFLFAELFCCDNDCICWACCELELPPPPLLDPPLLSALREPCLSTGCGAPLPLAFEPDPVLRDVELDRPTGCAGCESRRLSRSPSLAPSTPFAAAFPRDEPGRPLPDVVGTCRWLLVRGGGAIGGPKPAELEEDVGGTPV